MKAKKAAKTGPDEPATVPTSPRDLIFLPSILKALIEPAIGETAKTVVDLGITGGKALLAHFQNEGAIASRVLASWHEDDRFCIALEFINTTLHGGYVEEFYVRKPQASAFLVATGTRAERDYIYGDSPPPAPGRIMPAQFAWKKQEEILPVYISPYDTTKIHVQLIDDRVKVLENTEVVEISYRFSIAGGAEADNTAAHNTRFVKARLRKYGPVYNPS